jgi:hypothetical protein
MTAASMISAGLPTDDHRTMICSARTERFLRRTPLDNAAVWPRHLAASHHPIDPAK